MLHSIVIGDFDEIYIFESQYSSGCVGVVDNGDVHFRIIGEHLPKVSGVIGLRQVIHLFPQRPTEFAKQGVKVRPPRDRWVPFKPSDHRP